MSNNQRSTNLFGVRFALLALAAGVLFSTYSIGTGLFGDSANAQRVGRTGREKETVSSPAAAFTAGSIVVYRVDNSGAGPSGSAAPVFLDEYSPVGTLIQSIAMPTAVAGANKRLTASNSATSEGQMTRSSDGRFIVLTGYDADVATAAVTGTASATTNRVVGRVSAAGVVDTSTALTDAYSANNIRGVASSDGTNIWVSGTGTNPGVRFTTFGTVGTSTQLSTTVTNIRTVNIFGGQLYSGSASGAFQGVSTVGTGLPTTSGQTTTLLPGFPTAAGPSTYGFYLANPTTLYVCDDRATAAGGIQKWTFDGTNWSNPYTIATGTNIGCRGLAGIGTVLYATTAEASAQRLITVTDTGAASVFTTLATAATGQIFRGLALAPAASTAAGVGISGRVTTADGRGITNAVVTITGNSLAQPRNVITGRRGTYMFDDLEPGETYIVTVNARRFTFSNPSQVVSIVDNVSDADFVADGGSARPVEPTRKPAVVLRGKW